MKDPAKRRNRAIRTLIRQVRDGIERFVQSTLDHPDNLDQFSNVMAQDRLAATLWHEGLVVALRLLFILKLESLDDPADSFPFVSTELWKEELSLGRILAAGVGESGPAPGEVRALEESLRALFVLLSQGSSEADLTIPAMDSTLFGSDRTRHLDRLHWGERGVGTLLDRLFWVRAPGGAATGDRIDYHDLEAEDLGQVYESLIVLEPGIASESMCRLAVGKREIVVSHEQGERYRRANDAKIVWVEAISPGRFYLTSGLGRRTTGTFYTPSALVRLLVRETLGPIVEDRSPAATPRPAEILRIRLLDPATGSGRFLVEACRFLGRKLLDAIECRLDQGIEDEFRWVIAEGGGSPERSERICRSLIAGHCLNGIDRDRLAIELTRLALWFEGAVPGHEKLLHASRLLCADFLTLRRLEELPAEPESEQPIHDRASLHNMISAEEVSSTFEEAFPDVFLDGAASDRRRGFDAIIGNPPWDKLRVESRELLGESDPAYLSGKESAGTESTRRRLASGIRRGSRAEKLVAYYRGVNRLIRRVYPSAAWKAAGNVDAYRAFVARATQIQAKDGRLGFVVGSAFAKTTADAPLRRFLFNERGSLVCLLHFINTKRQFESLPPVLEFSAFVQSGSSITEPARLAFDVDHIDPDSAVKNCIEVPQAVLSRMLRETGSIVPGPLPWKTEAGQSISALASGMGVTFGIDISRTHDGESPPLIPLRSIIPGAADARSLPLRSALLEKGYVPAYTGKSMRMYEDFPRVKRGKWKPEVGIVGDVKHPRVARCLDRMRDYRIAYRSTPGSPQTNARTLQVAMLPPGVLATNSIHPEREPSRRPHTNALVAMAILNSFSVDAWVRPHVTANINQALLDMIRIPPLDLTSETRRFLAHGALRLVAAHEGFRVLWLEQLAGASQPLLEQELPAVSEERDRLELRSGLDAAVAHLFRLDRKEYAQLLGRFRHKENPETPKLCLARFEELQSIGVEAFGKRHDPHWKIMENESLPTPGSHPSPGPVK